MKSNRLGPAWETGIGVEDAGFVAALASAIRFSPPRVIAEEKIDRCGSSMITWSANVGISEDIS